MGCAMGNDPGARSFDLVYGGGSRVAVGGWTAFLAFVILVIQGLMIALRFLNLAAAFRYPVLVVLVVSMCVVCVVVHVVISNCVHICPSLPTFLNRTLYTVV